MANKQLQLRRGSATDHTTTNGGFVGAEGEITMDTSTNSVRVHDGSATGGYELLRADMSNVAATGSTITIDAKVVLSDAAYATVNGDSSLTLATKGWVSSQASSGGLVGVLDNVGDVEIGVKATTNGSTLSTGQFLIYDEMTVDGSTVERWTNKSVSGVVNFTSEGVTSFTDGAIDANNLDTISDGVITNAKLVNSSLTTSDGTLSGSVALGSTLTVTGVANEISVTASTVDGSLSIGIVDDVQLGGSVTADTLSVTNNLTVGGNLTVSGTTTTINTETINLADNIIELNSNLTNEDPSQNAGIEVNRGTLSNVSLIWDETGDNWQVTEDGTNFYNIVHVGDLKTVSTSMIADSAVDTLQIAGSAITAAKIANGEIKGVAIEANTISSTKLSDFTDTLAKTSGNLMVANGSTLTSLPTAGDVTVTAVTASTITLTISDDAIDTTKIADDAGILGSQLADATIPRTKLSTTAGSKITASQLEDNAVGTAQILNNTVNENKLTASVAGNGLTGGNGSALEIDLSSVTYADISVANDSIAFLDITTNGSTITYATRNESVADFVDAFSGSHMTATNGVLSIDNFTGVTAGSVTQSKAVLVDANSDISGFGVVGATTFSGTLSGQVSTATQSSITSIPNLATVGALDNGSITSNFGSINVGTSAITGGTITASAFAGPIAGDVTGDVTGDLTGQVSTATQSSITSIPNLVTVGALDSGSITDGFTSIDVGTGAISGGTITGVRITDGTASIQGGTITANKVVIDSLTVDNGSLVQSGALSISSSDSTVTVEDVVFTGGALTSVSSISASGTITANAFSGNLSGTTATLSGAVTGGSVTDGTATLASGTISGLTKAVVDQLTIDNASITQAGTSTNLTISATDGTVTVDGVVFNAGAVSSVTSLTAANEITATTLTGTLSTAAQPSITSVGTLTSLGVDQLSIDTHIISSSTIMQISAGASKAVTIESVSINDADVTGVSTLTTTGNITVGGDVAVNGGDITSTATTLSLSADTAVQVESVVFTDGAVTGVSTLTATGAVQGGSVTDGTATLAAGTLSGATKIVVDELTIDDTSITQEGSGGAKNLTVSASNGNVLIEDVTFNGGAITNVTNLTAANVITANTFVGAFSGEVSSDVLTASTLSVTTQFKLDSAAFYIDNDEVTATATEINRLASIDTSNDTAGKLAVVNSDGYIHGSFKSLSSQGGTGALLQNVLFDVRNTNGDTVFKIDPVSSDETIVKTARLAVDDSLLQVNANTSASAADNQHDIGIFGNLGAGKAAAVVYDRSDSAWKLVDDINVPENAINTIDPTDAQLSNLEVKGIRTAAGVQRAVATAGQNAETLTSANHVWFQDGSTYGSVTLPDAADHAGREFIIRNTASTSGDITVNSAGGTIDASSTGLVPSYGAVKFISDGSNWWTI